MMVARYIESPAPARTGLSSAIELSAKNVNRRQLRILAGAHAMSPQGFERIQGLRRVVYNSHDYAEGVRAFKQKRKPVFRGE